MGAKEFLLGSSYPLWPRVPPHSRHQGSQVDWGSFYFLKCRLSNLLLPFLSCKAVSPFQITLNHFLFNKYPDPNFFDLMGPPWKVSQGVGNYVFQDFRLAS